MRLDFGHCAQSGTGFHEAEFIKDQKPSILARILIRSRLFEWDEAGACKYVACQYCGKKFCLTHKEQISK